MSIVGGPSTPADRDDIASLMQAALGIDADAPSIEPALLDWKYWSPHPLTENERSRVLKDQEALVAHGGIWPIRLQTASGAYDSFHLIDWVARREVAGAGIGVLRECSRDMAAAFSIGGSAITRKILPMFGFKAYNSLTFLSRPLSPLQPALRESPADLKMGPRVVRNLWRYVYPPVKLPGQWRISEVEPDRIAPSLWPVPSTSEAVSHRSPELLSHIQMCPAVRRSVCVQLSEGDGLPKAYMLLVQVRDQVRLADYGPAHLDEDVCRILGLAAQSTARSMFSDASLLIAATSEPHALAGFLQSGLRISAEEQIKVKKVNGSLPDIDRFRLTLADWDSLFL